MNESQKRKIGVAAFTALAAAVLLACGGGDNNTATQEIKNCVNFVDSFGKPVTCYEMKDLPGASFAAIESGGDSSSSDGDAGADGAAADGAPIVNTKLVFTDINGKTIETTTDSAGQFRINLRGMKAPLVATVQRSNLPWKSVMISDIVRAPANNKFYTINMTKLTDLVSSELAKAAGKAGADSITPQIVLEQRSKVTGIIGNINAQILTSLVNNGLDPVTFNPLSTPFAANRTGADKVLEEVVVVRDSTATVITGVKSTPPAPTTPTPPPQTGISAPV